MPTITLNRYELANILMKAFIGLDPLPNGDLEKMANDISNDVFEERLSSRPTP